MLAAWTCALLAAAPDPSATPEGSNWHARYSAGVDLGGNFTFFTDASQAQTVVPGAGQGFFVRGGAQRADTWGVELEASIGALVLWGFARVGAFAVLPLGERFSLALGAVFDATYGHQTGLAFQGVFSGTGAGRWDIHLLRVRGARGERRALTLSIALEAGAVLAAKSFSRGGPSAGAFLMVGPSWY